MNIRQYQVDAFASQVFAGNPAAVCPLDNWLDESLMQAIAAENNLSETAFFIPAENGFHLRWFTPVSEVDLCGHATLATAHVLFNELGYAGQHISFMTRSGELTVAREDTRLAMNFPASIPQKCPTPEALVEGLGAQPSVVFAAEDYLAVFDNEAAIHRLAPDMSVLRRLDRRGVCVTAPGDSVDFVSRFFAPKHGIPEDPVTGSAHCMLTPYWASRLGKQTLDARQVSKRGGDIRCQLQGERVILSGHAVTFMVAEIRTGD